MAMQFNTICSFHYDYLPLPPREEVTCLDWAVHVSSTMSNEVIHIRNTHGSMHGNHYQIGKVVWIPILWSWLNIAEDEYMLWATKRARCISCVYQSVLVSNHILRLYRVSLPFNWRVKLSYLDWPKKFGITWRTSCSLSCIFHALPCGWWDIDKRYQLICGHGEYTNELK